jgi:hypothetical protein
MLQARRLAKRLSLAVACASVAIAALGTSVASAGPTVTVRIEGEAATLLPATSVTLNAPEPVSNCAANSVAAAINLAVGGNWDHGEANGGAGNFTETILGETHDFTHNSDTWAEWVDYKWGAGICTDTLNQGDEVLMVADHEPEPFFSPTAWPLVVTGAPAVASVGVPFTVSVNEIRTPAGAFAESGQGTPTPVAGVSVGGTGASSSPSDANGVATITPTSAGMLTLRATKAGDAPSATFVVCAHAGDDGNCGTPATTAGGTTGSTAPSTATVAYKGPFALVAHASDLIDGHVYSRAHAPRLLSGAVLSHSRVASVSLKLRRSYRGRCFAYGGTTTRFARARCGSGAFFRVATTPNFSYLLPSALARGRYVLDIQATDVAGNATALARGSTRIVFYVR